jgi:hypothetical protein
MAFVEKVLERNSNVSLRPDGVNTYVTITDEVIQFTRMAPTCCFPLAWESRIVSITNGPSLPGSGSTPMAFGDIVNSQAGSGIMTITNAYTGQVRTLEFHDPAHPVVSDSNITPLTSVTCLSGFVWRRAYRRVAAQDYDFVVLLKRPICRSKGRTRWGRAERRATEAACPALYFVRPIRRTMYALLRQMPHR